MHTGALKAACTIAGKLLFALLESRVGDETAKGNLWRDLAGAHRSGGNAAALADILFKAAEGDKIEP
jgi:hypothetical protein